MINFDIITIEKIIEKLISQTKSAERSWDIVHHHGYSPRIAESYIRDLNSKGITTLSDSYFTKHKLGFFYIFHLCPTEKIKCEDMAFSHGIAPIDEIAIEGDDYYIICVQTNEELYLEEITSHSPRMFSEKIDGKLYALHQIILRSASRVEDYISEFLESDPKK